MKSIVVPKFNIAGRSFELSVPSSKSIANRALILAALTNGTTRLRGDFEAEDIQLMIGGLKKMGIRVISGVRGIKIINDLGWRKNTKNVKLFLGNSGTSIRFLTSLMCFRSGNTVLTGKPRMLERPIADLVDALRQAGAKIEYLGRPGYPPLRVIGQGCLKGGRVAIKADTSSQFLSSLILVSSACEKPIRFSVAGKRISKPYIDMTKAMTKKWRPGSEFVVEGDASAAVYWWALGFLHDCTITVKNIPKNSIQGDVKFLNVLKTLRALPAVPTLRTFDMNDMPDAALMLMAIAPFMKFPIRIMNVGSLRVKETDRIEAMATELRKVGVKVKTGRDWIEIHPLAHLKGGIIRMRTYDDHRIAMSMAILGTRLGNFEILDPDCVKKTYPGFWKKLKAFNKKPRR